MPYRGAGHSDWSDGIRCGFDKLIESLVGWFEFRMAQEGGELDHPPSLGCNAVAPADQPGRAVNDSAAHESVHELDREIARKQLELRDKDLEIASSHTELQIVYAEAELRAEELYKSNLEYELLQKEIAAERNAAELIAEEEEEVSTLTLTLMGERSKP